MPFETLVWVSNAYSDQLNGECEKCSGLSLVKILT